MASQTSGLLGTDQPQLDVASQEPRTGARRGRPAPGGPGPGGRVPGLGAEGLCLGRLLGANDTPNSWANMYTNPGHHRHLRRHRALRRLRPGPRPDPRPHAARLRPADRAPPPGAHSVQVSPGPATGATPRPASTGPTGGSAPTGGPEKWSAAVGPDSAWRTLPAPGPSAGGAAGDSPCSSARRSPPAADGAPEPPGWAAAGRGTVAPPTARPGRRAGAPLVWLGCWWRRWPRPGPWWRGGRPARLAHLQRSMPSTPGTGGPLPGRRGRATRACGRRVCSVRTVGDRVVGRDGRAAGAARARPGPTPPPWSHPSCWGNPNVKASTPGVHGRAGLGGGHDHPRVSRTSVPVSAAQLLRVAPPHACSRSIPWRGRTS